MRPSILALSSLAGVTNAHTIFQRVHVNGVDQGYLYGMRYPTVSELLRSFLTLTIVLSMTDLLRT